MSDDGLAARLRGLASEFVRFALVGGAATLVHAAVYAALLGWTSLHPQTANIAGFLSAFGISALGHHRVTFKTADGKRSLAASSWRLTVTATLGYALNALFVHLVTDVLAVDARLAIIPMIGVTPFVTYAFNRSWVFYGRRSGQS